MAEENKTEKNEAIVSMQRTDLIGIIVLGGVVGLFIWGLGMVLDRFVFDAYLCQSAASSQCANAKSYAAAAATIIGGILALLALIRLRVYRPLLVLLATLISLWGLIQAAWSLPWYQGVVIALLTYALAFGLFAWVARLRQFWIALVTTIVLVIAVRLAQGL